VIGSLLVYGVGEKMTRRLAGMVVGCQALIMCFWAFVAYGLAKGEGHHGDSMTYLYLGLGLAVICIFASASMRRPFGALLGWLVQLCSLLATLVVPMMFFVGVIFLALWITALYQGRKMDALTARYLREHA
jgi:hypothetical protein